MDSITQAALGAAIGEAVLGRKIGNKGALLGAVVATIPDLDILFLPFLSDLQRISVHRGYSHSILFAIVGSLLIAWILSRIKWTKMLSYSKLWIFSFLALFTHMLLDAFTTYGTQLLLPFSDQRIGFDSITIVDPVYTLPLLIGLFITLVRNRQDKSRRTWNYAGLIFSSAYLVFTLFNKSAVKQNFEMGLKQKGIEYEELLTVPVALGSLLWYGVARTDEGLYIGNYSVFDEELPMEYDFFPKNDSLLNGLDPYLVDRMKWFSKDYYSVIKAEGKIRLYNLQCDMAGTNFGKYKAPTAFYFEISPGAGTDYKLDSGMHEDGETFNDKFNRIFNH